ncbi:hypothetical protein KDW_32840 [Dictyobacter vulcani]|uniref:Uncharacterized protein n=1 Tax=Dictyobacter vulcani TaxID=2607529 RepID=A0A5J4KPL9_9CHLR|nr:hypothetical protein [Dictyobacter vulcani]GER89122.1 hypothetical protein KDW_32840 [Dictyobacter vulcani]
MNIWDSVHRSLEKASHEAGRIARIQRTRLQITQLGRQISDQERELVAKVMDLYSTGLLSQNELQSPCQELFQAHQQLTQAQQELQTLHNQNPTTIPPEVGATYPIQTPDGEIHPTQYAPPLPYEQPYMSPTIPVTPSSQETQPVTVQENQFATLLPPPPPGIDPLTIHAPGAIIDTMDAPRIQDEPADIHRADDSNRKDEIATSLLPQHCPACDSPAESESLYCHNCGTALQQPMVDQLPTIRGTSPSTAFEQLRADALQAGSEENEIMSNESSSPSIDTPSSEKDRG